MENRIQMYTKNIKKKRKRKKNAITYLKKKYNT